MLSRKEIKEKLVGTKIRSTKDTRQAIVRLLELFGYDVDGDTISNKDMIGYYIHEDYTTLLHEDYTTSSTFTYSNENYFIGHPYNQITLDYLKSFESMLVEKDEVTPNTKKYLVFVEGKANPKKVHDTIESANKEAIRLANIEVGKLISVCEVVEQYKSRITVIKL